MPSTPTATNGPDVKARTKGFEVIEWIEAHCVHTAAEWTGRPFRLFDWQKRLLLQLFEVNAENVRRYRWALVGVSKKAGKTELAAAVALFMLIADGEPSPLVVCAAASDEQADLVYGAARTMCERSPTLSLITECFDREILVPSIPGARLKRVAAVAGTNDGQNISCVVADELHEWVGGRGEAVWNVLTNGTGARRQPLVFQITTAGYDTESIAYKQYQHGRAVEAGQVDDPRYLMHWIEAPADADYRDPAVWRAANPSFGITVHEDFYADQLTKKSASVFRRYFLNQWVESEDGWIEPSAWDACAGDVEFDPSRPAYVGVDIGFKQDSSAVAVAQLDPSGKLHVRVLLRTPSPGHPTAVADVRADVAQLAGELRVEEVAFDPYHFRESAEILEERGITTAQFDQNDSRMAPASETLFELIREGRLVHDGDLELRSHVLAAVPSRTERGVRISKRRSKKRIDAAVALAMAADRAVHAPPPEERGPAFEVLV